MMKGIFFISLFMVLACSQPKHVTFNPDDAAATSGTVGSSKATTQLPKETIDTTLRKDAVRSRRNHQ